MAFNKEEAKKLRLAYLACGEFYARVTEFYSRSASRAESLPLLREKIKREYIPFLDIHIGQIKAFKSPFSKIHTVMQVSEDMDHDRLLIALRDLIFIILEGLGHEQFKMNLIAHVHCAGINKQLQPLAKDKQAAVAWAGLVGGSQGLLSVFMEPAQYLLRYIMLLEEMQKKINALDQINFSDKKSIQGQINRLKTVITNLNGDWINAIPVYYNFIFKINELCNRPQTEEVKEKIERLSLYKDELNKSFNSLEKTSTSSAEMIKQLLNDPMVSKRTGFSFGKSSVAKNLQSILDNLNAAEEAREQIMLTERRRETTSYPHLQDFIKKDELLEIISQYEKSRGFWRKYAPFVPAKTKTMEDLTVLSVKEGDKVSVRDVTDILMKRDDRASKVRVSSLGSVATLFFGAQEGELEKLSLKDMSATDKAIQSLAKAFDARQ